jgi:hypothetical protein
MFESLSEKLGGVFGKLRGKGSGLSENDVMAVSREVRIALLEADVALPVVAGFIAIRSPTKAVGQNRCMQSSVNAGPASHQDRSMTRLLKCWAREEVVGNGPSNAAPSGRHHDGRPARLGQDHDDCEARQAAQGEAQ